MEYLFENPIPMLMVGAVLLTFTGVLYYSTRGVGSFVSMVVIAVLMLSGLVMEQLVYTEREQVELVITGVTDAAKHNDLPRVLSYLSPTATRTRQMAEKLMPELKIEKANIIGEIKIDLDDEQHPTTATATFDGFFYATHKSGAGGGDRFPVTVQLVRDKYRWMIEDFHSDQDFETEAAKLMR